MSSPINHIISKMGRLELIDRKYRFQPNMFQNQDENVITYGEHNLEDLYKAFMAGKYPYLCEKFGLKWDGNTTTKFFLDIDIKKDTKKEALEVLKFKEFQDKIQTEHIIKMFKEEFKVDLEESDIIGVWRDDIKKQEVKGTKKSCYKASRHVVVKNSKVQYEYMNQLISLLSCKYPDFSYMYDYQAYVVKNQNFQMVNAQKSEMDKRVLKYEGDLTFEVFKQFMVQYIPDDCIELPVKKAVSKLSLDYGTVALKQGVQVSGVQNIKVEYTKEQLDQIPNLLDIYPKQVYASRGITMCLNYNLQAIGLQEGNRDMFFEDFCKMIYKRGFEEDYEDFKEMIKVDWWDKLPPSKSMVSFSYFTHLAQLYAPQEYNNMSDQLFMTGLTDTYYSETNYFRYLMSIFQGNIYFINDKMGFLDFDKEKKKWVQIPYSLKIDDHINTYMSSMFMQRAEIFRQMAIEETDEELILRYIKYAALFQEQANKCQKIDYINKIVGYFKKYITNKEIYDKFDSRLDVINFENGILELLPDGPVFRERTIDDLVLNSTGYDYVENPPIEDQQYLLNSLRNSYTFEEVFEYFLDVSAYALNGNKYLEFFLVLEGRDGRNGKGISSRLQKTTFGGYYADINAQCLLDNGMGKANEANSQILSFKKARIVNTSEPPDSKKIDKEFIKKLRGGDHLTARGNYLDFQTFANQALLIIQANDYLKFNAIDTPTIDTMRIIKYDIKFVDTQEEVVDKFTKLKDIDLKTAVEQVKYAQAFMALLVKRYYEKGFNKRKVISVPDQIKYNAATNAEQYIDSTKSSLEKICVYGDKSDYVSSTELYENFLLVSGKRKETFSSTKFYSEIQQISGVKKNPAGERIQVKGKKICPVFGLKFKEDIDNLFNFNIYLMEIIQEKKVYGQAELYFKYLDFLEGKYIKRDIFDALLREYSERKIEKAAGKQVYPKIIQGSGKTGNVIQLELIYDE